MENDYKFAKQSMGNIIYEYLTPETSIKSGTVNI
jgi:hypothetical protein